jgi:putative colanic acid biosynthesis acetyltransferase WcaF
MLSAHRAASSDGYLRPPFSRRDKLRRFLWQLSWQLFCRWTPKPLHQWRIWVLRQFGAKIGEQNFVYPDCRIWAPWLLETEAVVTIGPRVEVYNPGGVYLGHHTILSQGAFLCGATHDYNSPDFTYLKQRIVLEPYVWICANATVLPGVRCGEGSVLGAAAVVAKNTEPWMVYGGNPARALKKRTNFLTLPSAVPFHEA